MYGPEFFEQFGVPEAAPNQATADFTGKFLNPEGRAAPSRFFAVKPTPEPFGQRSDAPQASQYAGNLEVSEDGRYEQLPFQQKTDEQTPKIQTFNKIKIQRRWISTIKIKKQANF